MKLTVICWLWKLAGRRPTLYSYHHVNALFRQFRENLSLPHRFVCITDSPRGIECETYPLWDFPKVKLTIRRGFDCWKRLKLFDPDLNRQFGDYIVSTDLGVVVWELDKLLNFSNDFTAMGGQFSPINGGFWMLRTGCLSHVWKDFDPETSGIEVNDAEVSWRRKGKRLVGSDQGWMSLKIPNPDVWSHRDGVYHMRTLFASGLPDNLRYLSFPGAIKPWFAKVKRNFPEIHERYMRYLDKDYANEVERAIADGRSHPEA